MAVKHQELATERVWVRVHAVANPGIIVGELVNSIQSPVLLSKQFPVVMTMDEDYHLLEGAAVSFPVTCVFGVEHGENWEG